MGRICADVHSFRVQIRLSRMQSSHNPRDRSNPLCRRHSFDAEISAEPIPYASMSETRITLFGIPEILEYRGSVPSAIRQTEVSPIEMTSRSHEQK